MNILILTPDAVGSTLLQRLITIYMQFHEYDRPVINLHELTNGLEKYFSPEFNQEIVSKRKVQNWRYYQSLQDIVDILSSVDHYKTSRLAQYHIKCRQDPVEQQIPFYQYLDNNFYVISCRRHNVFEHALSMALNRVTKKLNVFSPEEKIHTFYQFYQHPIDIDPESLISALEDYRDYLTWSDTNFNVASYFYYDKHLANIEQYILNLPIFPGAVRQKITWQEKFGIDFNDWNRCHRMTSDIGSLALDNKTPVHYLTRCGPNPDQNLLDFYQTNALPEWPRVESTADIQMLPHDIKYRFEEMIALRNMPALLSDQSKLFYDTHDQNYRKVKEVIDKMVSLDIIVTPPPIKKQTLAEKRHIVRNFDQCVIRYNEWILENPTVGTVVDTNSIESHIENERRFWALSSETVSRPQLVGPTCQK